jgi:hypothetical protein
MSQRETVLSPIQGGMGKPLAEVLAVAELAPSTEDAMV